MSEVVMLIFPSRETMLDAVDRIKSLPYARMTHSALIAKAEDGETTVYEDDINPNEGGIAGGTLGALMGALGIAGLGAFLLPGVGPIVAIGAAALVGGLVGGATGGITAGVLDMGINNKQLENLAEHLNAGKIAMVVELEGNDKLIVSRLNEDLKPFQAEIVQH
ncbi:MAG: hypothetical protein GC204_12270 [Chloroflexi bacterium]|nr:hypothetical protein [Chloroflexota bacterium]